VIHGECYYYCYCYDYDYDYGRKQSFVIPLHSVNVLLRSITIL